MSRWAHICTHALHSSLSQLTLEMLIPDLTQFLWKLGQGGSKVIIRNLFTLTYIIVPFLLWLCVWVTLLHKQTSVYFLHSYVYNKHWFPVLFCFPNLSFIMYLHSSTLRNGLIWYLLSGAFYFSVDRIARVAIWHLPKEQGLNKSELNDSFSYFISDSCKPDIEACLPCFFY